MAPFKYPVSIWQCHNEACEAHVWGYDEQVAYASCPRCKWFATPADRDIWLAGMICSHAMKHWKERPSA